MTREASRRNAYSNQNRVRFPGVGVYGIPAIKPVCINVGDSELLRFDYCIREPHPENKIVHFFADDYVFERCWSNPDRYINVLARFRAVVAPDFSLYTDYPRVVQAYSHFKKHWLAAYWQMSGLTVIPCIRWLEGEGGFDWCLDGEPMYSTICVSTQGCIKGQRRKDDYLEKLQHVVNILKPASLIIFGDTYPGLLDLEYGGHIEYVDNAVIRRKRGGALGGSSSNARRAAGDNVNWEDTAPAGYHLYNDGNVDAAMTVDKWERSLTPEEEKALHAWTSEEVPYTDLEMHQIINQTIMGTSDDPRGKRYAKEIEGALDRYYLKQNTIVHGVYSSDLFGGANTVAQIKEKVGEVVSVQGLMSTSSVPNSDKYPNKKDRMAIHVKTPQGKGIGGYVKNHSDYDWEREFLFNTGSNFRIEGAWKDYTGLVHVNLTYIGRSK